MVFINLRKKVMKNFSIGLAVVVIAGCAVTGDPVTDTALSVAAGAAGVAVINSLNNSDKKVIHRHHHRPRKHRRPHYRPCYHHGTCRY